MAQIPNPSKGEDAMAPQQELDRQHETPGTGAPPAGRWYEVGGRRLMLLRSGTGGPAVVILPGASAVGLDYLNIHDRISEFTTSVLYDRGGTGWSDPVDLPRSAADVAEELHDLLRAAGVPGPYLLAAHSLGGAYARRFAQLFPGDVAGFLYLDAFYEETDTFLPERLHLASVRQPDPGRLGQALMRPFARRMYRQMFAGWPDGLRQTLVARHVSAAWWQVGVQERSTMAQLAGELHRGGPVPDRPSIVLTATRIDPGLRLFMSPSALRAMTEGNRRLYAALAASVTHGELRALGNARHSTLTIDQADAVVQAARDLFARAANR
jgi:pimeloyl-ACP methyl ester carboxylesterase